MKTYKQDVWRPLAFLSGERDTNKVFYRPNIFWRGIKYVKINTVNFLFKPLGLYIFVRGFRRAYKRRSLYPGGGGL